MPVLAVLLCTLGLIGLVVIFVGESNQESVFGAIEALIELSWKIALTTFCVYGVQTIRFTTA